MKQISPNIARPQLSLTLSLALHPSVIAIELTKHFLTDSSIDEMRHPLRVFLFLSS